MPKLSELLATPAPSAAPRRIKLSELEVPITDTPVTTVYPSGSPEDDVRRLNQGGKTFAMQSGIADQEAADYQSKVDALNRQEGLGRTLGLGGRAMLSGVAAIPDLIAAPASNLLNRILPDNFQTSSISGAINTGLDKAGVPRPENAQERIGSDITSGVTGAATGVGVGNFLQQSPNLVRSLVGRTLATNPATQLASGATGAGAASATREAGGGMPAQLAAGLIGGIGPSMAQAGTAAAVRGTLRGGEAGRQRVAGNIEAFERAGTSPSVGQATERPVLRGVEQTLSRTPGAAGVMVGRARDQAEEIGQGVEKVAQGLSAGSSAGKAGTAVVRGTKKFVEDAKATANQLYEKVDSFIPPETRIDVTNTKTALGKLNAPIPGAPNVSKFFQNSKVQGIEGAIDKDLAIPTNAQASLDDALAKIDSLYASRNDAVQDMGRFSSFANDQANRTGKFYPVEGTPRFPGRYSEFPARAAEAAEAAGEAGTAAMGNVSRARQIEGTLEQLQKAAAATNGKLPYEAIKKLRTMVGQELDDAGLMSDFPRSKFKALYSALSDDLEAAAKAQSPEAAQAAKRASNYYKALQSRTELLDSVIDKNGGPEKVFSALASTTKDGNTTIKAVMQSLPKEGQRELAAAFVRRLGRAVNSQQDETGEAFSANTFLTNWNNISKEARKTLFDRFGPGFSDNMDQIAKVAANLKAGSSTFANPSGTAAAGAQIAGLTSFVTSLATGNAGLAAGIAGGAGTANLWARAMTNPRFVSWLANSTKLPVSAIPAQAEMLRQIAERQNEPELAEAAELIEQGYQSQQNETQQQ